MGFEVEIKFRTEGHAGLASRIVSMGGKAGPSIDQEDVYLAHPGRDFAQSGEAFRIRREGGTNRLTYKGPRHPGPTKTREEIEIAFAEGEEAQHRMRRLWELLGFRPVAVLRKRRQGFHLVYQGRPIEVALDEAEDLGTFAEVEALADDANDLAAAQQAVMQLAGALGLTAVEPRSYLRMALERRAAAAGTASEGESGAPTGPSTGP